MENYKPHKGDIKKRLILQFAGFTALSMLLLGVVLFMLLQQTMKQSSRLHLYDRAEAVLALFEQRLAYLQENTERLAVNPFVIESLINPEDRLKDLPRLAENFAEGRDVTAFGLVDFDGQPIFESGIDLPAYNDMLELRVALAQADLSMFITDLGQLAFVVPIEYYQTTQGAIIVTFDLHAIAMRNAPPLSEGYLIVKNEKGELSNIGKDENNDYFFAEVAADKSYPRLQSLNISLQFGELSSLTDEAAWSVLNKITGIALLIIIIAVVAAVWMGNSLANPVLTLYKRVKQSIDDASVRCSPLGTDDELEALAQAFDQRTDALQVYSDDLEKQVSQRTAALEETANNLNEAQRLAAIGSYNWDIVTGKLIWTEEHYRLVGLEPFSVEPTYEVFINAVHEDDREMVNQAIKQAIEEHQPYKCEHRIVYGDKQIRYVLGAGFIHYAEDGWPIRMAGTLQDVTEKVETEKALRELTEKAENASRAKSRFLANMSHEIRTPMNAIIGMTGLVLKTKLDQQQTRYLNNVYAAGNGLLGILNDILDFSKIESGKLEIENIDFLLDDVIHNVQNILSLKCEEKGIHLHYEIVDDVPNLLTGDPLRLGQILINLGNNAVKFTPKGGRINIGIDIQSQNKDQVVLKFWVADTGIGMNQEQQRKLFIPFSQTDASTTREYGGTGLGLSISKKLCEMMHGKIWVQSIEHQGSTFSFELPYGIPSGSTHHRHNNSHINNQEKLDEALSRLKNKKLLVVEDNEINLELVVALLEGQAIEVQTAENGEQALALLQQQAFDLVLMDCQMPVMDGYEATRQIRKQDKFKKLPIVALTANALKGDREMVLEAGMNDHIAKPIDPQIMFTTMAKWL